MVFNWFNRFKKQEKKPEAEPTLPEAPLEVSPPPEEAEPYYMRLAREIQRKEEQKLEELPVAVSTPVPKTPTPEAPVFESQKLEEPQKVELNEDIFDWQKILYGSTPAPAPSPIVEKPPEPVIETPIPVLEPIAETPTPILEPIAETPIPILEKPPETFPLPTPIQEPVVQPPIVTAVTPVSVEPEIELPITPTVEAAVSSETMVDQSHVSAVVESPLPLDEKPLETLVPFIEKPLETIAEGPAPIFEKPLETIAEVLTPVEPTIQVPEVPELPVLEPIAKADPLSTPTTEPEPAPQPAADIPFWKRILGQRAFYPPTPPPTAEVPPPAPTAEIPPPAPILEPPVEPAAEVPPEPPVVLPPTPASPVEPEPSSDSEAVPFWKRILGQRPATTPTPTSPEVSPVPREKPTAEPQPTQFDVGFLWSAEVLAAQGRRPEDVTLEEISWLQKLRLGLGRTRRGLVNNMKAIVGRGPLGPQEIEELEELLLQADVGIGVSEKILESLQARVKQEALPPDQAMTFLKNQLRQQVELKGDDPAKFAPLRDQLNIWLVVGVNGVGKTTTIGKLASLASRSGYRTMIAAGDTFRAGAVSQVQIWAQRSNVPVISNPSPNADPASVVFDAIGAARARNIELLIVDTAGRLQNKKNLMDELAKIRRIIDKQGAGAHVESLLVLDSTTGQNGLQQAKVFTEVASLTGVVLTKLDGSSKGGIALAIVDELNLPIRFVGVGEKVDDLRPFNSYEFIEALLSDVED